MKPSVKATRLPLTYKPTGERIAWRFWREPRIYGQGKHFPAWCWEDAEGYVRIGPETWAEFVPYLRGYFESHNSTPLVDFS
jgi:hypothetical protein